MLGRSEMGLSLHCGAAACWLRAMRGVCDEEPFPASAFSSLTQQRAYRRSLQLRSAASLALVLYLFLPFFGPPHPPQAPSSSGIADGNSMQENVRISSQPRQMLRSTADRSAALTPDAKAEPYSAAQHTSYENLSLPSCLAGEKCALGMEQRRQPGLKQVVTIPTASSFAMIYFHSQAPWRRKQRRRRHGALHSFVSEGSQCLNSSQTQNLRKQHWGDPRDKRIKRFSVTGGSRVYRRPAGWGMQPPSTIIGNGNSPCASSQGQPSPLSFLFWSLWRPLPLSFRAQCSLLSFLALCCCCILVAYGVCGVAARGVAKEAILPAVAAIAAAISAVDFALLLLKSQSPEQAAATAAAGGWVLTRLSRPLLLLILQQPVHALLLRVVKTLPKVKSIIVALFLSVALFDWLGVILFAGTGGHEEFHSFQRGCISLLLVVTTVRLPQVLLCGYTVHEAAVLFIVVFYLIAAILLGLFAAAFFSAYREEEEADRQFLRSLRHRYLREAFTRLSQAGEGCLSVREWMVALLGLAALPSPSRRSCGDTAVACPEEGGEFASVDSGSEELCGNNSLTTSAQKRLGTAALVSSQTNADREELVASSASALAVVEWRHLRGDGEEGFERKAFSVEAVEEEALCAGRSLLTAWNCESCKGKRFAWSGCLTISELTTLQYAKESFLRLCRGEDGLASSLTFDEFAEVPAVLDYEHWKGSGLRSDTQRFEKPGSVLWTVCNLMADAAVGVALVVTFTQTQKFIRTASSLTGEPIEEEDAEGMPFNCFASPAASYWLQLGLTFIYFLAAALMLGTEISRHGFSSIRTVNKFDGVVGGVEILVEALCLAAGASSAFHPESAEEILDDLSRSLAIVRVVRGLRIGFRVKPLKQMVARLARAVRRLQTVLLLLLVLYYGYAVVGIELFGGIIECELEEYSGSEPEGDPSDWGLLNFNDLFSALVTLFLLTVNGWDDSLKALVKNTSVFKCGAYFVSFYILTDTILLNLLVALVLEAYEQVSAPPARSLSHVNRPPEEMPFRTFSSAVPLFSKVQATGAQLPKSASKEAVAVVSAPFNLKSRDCCRLD